MSKLKLDYNLEHQFYVKYVKISSNYLNQNAFIVKKSWKDKVFMRTLQT